MNTIQVEQKSYEVPPRVGFTVAHFLTVADIDRSARYYETVFGAVARRDPDGYIIEVGQSTDLTYG